MLTLDSHVQFYMEQDENVAIKTSRETNHRTCCIYEVLCEAKFDRKVEMEELLCVYGRYSCWDHQKIQLTQFSFKQMLMTKKQNLCWSWFYFLTFFNWKLKLKNRILIQNIIDLNVHIFGIKRLTKPSIQYQIYQKIFEAHLT